LFVCFFETGSGCATQVGLELEILLPQPPECWNYTYDISAKEREVFSEERRIALWSLKGADPKLVENHWLAGRTYP
jgi:hypothetical protein